MLLKVRERLYAGGEGGWGECKTSWLSCAGSRYSTPRRCVGSQAVLVRALGTSWDRGVRCISLVRLCLGPPAVGFA